MPISKEMRLLAAKWSTGTGWPKRLNWVSIQSIRGWTATPRFELRFPIMAVVGENGVGKSTVLQASASVYKSTLESRFRFASDFFPDTPWDEIREAEVSAEVMQGASVLSTSVRKPTERWRGNPERPERPVQYIDLSRIQPVSARTGYTRLANRLIKESSATEFEDSRLARLSRIIGRSYMQAKSALTEADAERSVPVISYQGVPYSGFHQGAGETTAFEFLQADIPRYALVLIDEIESSLHPKAQRRLVRDLADKCRDLELQIILTTHSPYVLDELPAEGRAYILETGGIRRIIYGVSPEFAMSKMDDVPHHECDLYVEDIRAQILLTEIISARRPDLTQRCQVIPAGAASVIQALGQMVSTNKFPRPTRAFLDGDQGISPGCINLPGGDAPERLVFEALKARNWLELATRIGRPHANVADECSRAMLGSNHHEWVDAAASKLVVGGDLLWQAMCGEWVSKYLPQEDAEKIVLAIEDAISGAVWREQAPEVVPVFLEKPAPKQKPVTAPSNDDLQLSLLSGTDAQG